MKRGDDFRKALGQPDEGFNRALDDALRQVSAKEDTRVMKKKFSVLLVAAVVAALALAGAAVAVGLNLFDLFGNMDGRLTKIAPQTALETNTPADVKTEELGETRAEFNSAYYDGQTLIAAYTIDNYVRVEPFEPDEAWLKAQLRQNRQVWEAPPMDGLDTALIDAYGDAVARGEAFGYVLYTLEPTDHCATDDGIDLPPASETRDVTPEGTLCCLREFETPLPDGARDRERLELHMPLRLFADRVYFDGTYFYESHEDRDAGELVATASRADGSTLRFAGEGTCDGVPVRVEASASEVYANVTITADGDVFGDPAALYPDAGGELWYELWLEDESGATLGNDRVTTDAARITAGFTGSGAIPERLTLHIDVAGEGDWTPVAVMEPVALTPVP